MIRTSSMSGQRFGNGVNSNAASGLASFLEMTKSLHTLESKTTDLKESLILSLPNNVSLLLRPVMSLLNKANIICIDKQKLPALLS